MLNLRKAHRKRRKISREPHSVVLILLVLCDHPIANTFVMALTSLEWVPEWTHWHCH